MSVYRLSKDHRAKVLNITVDHYDKAQALRAVMVARGELLSWWDALRIVDPTAVAHPDIPCNIVDNGHHDHGDFHTMTMSRNMAALLEKRLGVVLAYHDALHHVAPAKEVP